MIITFINLLILYKVITMIQIISQLNNSGLTLKMNDIISLLNNSIETLKINNYYQHD